MEDRTSDGQKIRIFNIIDEFTRECSWWQDENSEDVEECLAELFCRRGVPEYIRSDNGSEFTAKKLRSWLSNPGTSPLYIEPGSPWENGYIESFNGKMRYGLLNQEIFDTVLEARIIIEKRRREYNTIRPHRFLGYRPPAPETKVQPLLKRVG